MQKNLVIVESPAKAKTIERFLGKDYKVMSSFGHIRDLKKKNFGIDLASFEPQYEISEDKEQVVRDLQAQAQKAQTIWLASDEDREGEAISWHLAEVLNLNPEEANRIVFHEITKSAILNAIEHPRHIDLNLVDAQQARRVLDRLVGFKLSPILWKRIRPSLSAGRVQSVAVRLIVEREREIQAFTPTANYAVSALFIIGNDSDETVLKATLHNSFKTADEAHAFVEACKKATFEVEDITQKPLKRTPAPPFTTSTLQQEAARRLGFPVAQTMRVAQALYESGLITYMRTDSTNLSDFCLNNCASVIEQIAGKGYHKRRHYHTVAKGAQEAHEAIRPTDMSQASIKGTTQEKRLYDLIWKRTLACQMADAEIERTQVDIRVSNREERFGASGDVVKFDGFLRVYMDVQSDEEPRENTGTLPALQKGQILTRKEIIARQRFTTGPQRYNEATLVHKLEELGIGRPSTYAPTISTIQQREYVQRGDTEAQKRKCHVITLRANRITESNPSEIFGQERNRLLPTDTGIIVNDFLMEYFPDILDYNFTAHIEKDFDNVAEGKTDWKKLIKNFYKQFEPQVEHTLTEKTEHRIGERQLGIDPKSGKPVSVKIGRFGPMAQIGSASGGEKPRFASLKKGQRIDTISLEEALELFKLPFTLGEFEEKPIVVNVGRFGPYVQHNGAFVSIPKGTDPQSLTIEEAIALIEEKRQGEQKKLLRTIPEIDGLEILDGRFGPYIKYNGKNYRLTKQQRDRIDTLTADDCRKIIEAEENSTKPASRRRRHS
ncbi:MAG: type I DNA topoisomerase [Alloprevotella sp.]|nr:type I DNA topoisomerase [Alloprevotella sp.]